VKTKKECGKTAAQAVVGLWKEAIQSQTSTMPKGQETKSRVTVDSLRLSVSIVGALIAGGRRSFPAKLTPMIRALMTSIQNERDEICQISACSHMSKFLDLLSGIVPPDQASGFKRAYSKVSMF
jgi:hypothetical protein